MSVVDFAHHALFHLTGMPKLMNKETLELLHTPVLGNYALGWRVIECGWAQGKVLNHSGSNTHSYAVAWIAPNINFAAISACNLGADESFDAANQAIVVAVKRYVFGQ